MSPHQLLLPDLDAFLRRALEEDLGRAGDITSAAVLPVGLITEADFVARSKGRLAGLEIALETLRILDPGLVVLESLDDGSDIEPQTLLARVRGTGHGLLASERVALNLLSRLSGIATATQELVAAVAHTSARIVCTRKTTPGLRALEKYAVRVGGGSNHRFGLDDAMLIKDNHIALAGGVATAIERAKQQAGHLVRIEVEVDTIEQLEVALDTGVDAVLLDNMSPQQLAAAVAKVSDNGHRGERGRVVLEASGQVTPGTVAAIAETGVDVISVGFITHSAPALDIGLDFRPAG